MARTPKPIEPIDTAVSEILTYLRTRTKVSQDYLAAETGISQNRISNVLRGKNPATIGEIDLLAQAMRCTASRVIAAAEWAVTGEIPMIEDNTDWNIIYTLAIIVNPRLQPCNPYGLAALATPYDIRAQIEAEQEES